ncbi:hypothetical protein COCOR_04801 [Corallococcus coralloides DSM 2259]|uniref:Nucleoside phosphorylase domain-containing protein n=2 Tax=Corallococcus coralloides TaxID=184914 RepID=H8MKX1_CORCM|nr:hypothetical protein COCOR_04801 [Corallococcus coralloides DSM 2259]
MLRHLPGYSRLDREDDDPHTYYEAFVPTMRSDGARYRVLVTSLAGMGPIQAAAKAMAVVHRWGPRHVLFVGIAGGRRSVAGLGDVLVANQIADYTVGKRLEDRRITRWEVYRVDATLLDAAINLPGGWESRTQEVRPVPGRPLRHSGIILSGGDVLADGETLRQNQEVWDKLIGVEMEGGGTALALHQTGSRPRFLMIRGVSDLADAEKGSATVENWRPYACDVAAAYTRAFLESGPVPASSGPSDGAGSGDWTTLANLTTDYKAHIEASLPNGVSIARHDEAGKLEAALAENSISVVFGDSGAGKSALVKTVLDTRFAAWTQVWLGPNQVQAALSVVRRSSLPLQHALLDVLKASANARNVLVLDSVERIEPSETSIVRRFVHELLASDNSPQAAWRLIVISQTQSWAERAETILGAQPSVLIELGLLKSSDVEAALSATPALSWLVGHPETVAVLANLKTLGWVIQARAALTAGTVAPASHAAVADRLWRFWTDGRAEIQELLMRLAEREASFERSFALTDLRPGDARTFQQGPAHLPLRLNERTNHLEFEHDLAADWARFQFLKQIARNTARWSALASNPLWSAALRMLGQFLLRQPAGTATAWDEAFAAAEETEMPLASDMLLDALCLDPEAERFLYERVDLLLAENGKRMTRLLTRFHHIGTVPRVLPPLSDNPTLGLHIETRYRSVIAARWPPIVRFLATHRDRITSMLLPALAKLAETWLSGTPPMLANGNPTPFRREFAELAIAMARTVQVLKEQGVMFLSQDPVFFAAPLAGAPDLPDEVSCWALEMSGRRPISKDVLIRVAVARKRQAEERAARLKNDTRMRATESRRRDLPQLVVPGRHELEPWPLGAMRPIDHDFRNACLGGSSLGPLMRTRPTVAAEVLLALIIKDQPCEEYGAGRWKIKLGLEAARDGYPTAFWKTPFFLFLQIAPREALQAIIKLVNFCTDRWVDSARFGTNRSVPTVKLEMGNGIEKEFIGGPLLFGWTQENSIRDGNLHCALDALERWLTLQVDKNADIAHWVEGILKEGASVAFLGLLVNLGKYQPALLPGPLAPLLTSPLMFYWDAQCVEQVGSRFIGWHWANSSEVMFEFAKSWTLAAHRRQRFVDIVANLLKEDDVVAEKLQFAIPTWVIPNDPKQSLELRFMWAALDRANYHRVIDSETGAEVFALVYPESLRQEAKAWQKSHEAEIQQLIIPSQCEQLLRAQQSLSDDVAGRFYELLESSNRSSTVESSVKMKSMLALATTLVVCGASWLGREPTKRQRLVEIIRASALEVGETAVAIRTARISGGEDSLPFTAFAVMHLWTKFDESAEWEALVLRLLTCGDSRVVVTLVSIAYAKREMLGSTWWRFLQVGLFWSALVMLAPNYDDSERIGPIWHGWLARIRRFPLRQEGAVSTGVKIGRVLMGYQRLERARWARANGLTVQQCRGREFDARHSIGLDINFLGLLFNWLLKGLGTGDLLKDRELVLQLWDCEVEYMQAQGEADGECSPPSQQIGYDLLAKLGSLSVSLSPAEARPVWEAVLSCGPKAHYALQYFTRNLFLLLNQGCDVERFRPLWRSLVQYALDAKWGARDLYWPYGERLLGDLLGFGNEDLLKHLPSKSVPDMRDLYDRWAQAHLGHSEESVRRFCRFLSSEVGTFLRLDGLRWISAALRVSKTGRQWWRDENGDALVELLDTALTRNAPALANDAKAREALVELAAELAARNIPIALTLQERIRLFR